MDIIGVAGLGRDFNAIKNPDDELVKNYEEILEPTTEKAVFFAVNVLFPRWFVAALPWGLNNRLKATTDALKNFCLQVIAEKKEMIKLQGEDSVDILSLLMKSNDFADENLVDQLLTFLAAGYAPSPFSMTPTNSNRHETTSSAFTWTTYLLAKHPEFQSRLREEIHTNVPSPSTKLDPSVDLGSILESLPLLNGLSNEVLRLYPTVPVTLRVAVRPTTIGTQEIPQGTRVYLAPWAVNRSTKIWSPDAEEFHPERWIDADTGKPNNTGGVRSNYCNLTFLHGPRSCIGEKFARSELRALIAVFCGRFQVEMADPLEVPQSAGAITTKPKNGMKLKMQFLDGW
jgi:cytochrome P450